MNPPSHIELRGRNGATNSTPYVQSLRDRGRLLLHHTQNPRNRTRDFFQPGNWTLGGTLPYIRGLPMTLHLPLPRILRRSRISAADTTLSTDIFGTCDVSLRPCRTNTEPSRGIAPW